MLYNRAEGSQSERESGREREIEIGKEFHALVVLFVCTVRVRELKEKDNEKQMHSIVPNLFHEIPHYRVIIPDITLKRLLRCLETILNLFKFMASLLLNVVTAKHN